MIKEMGPEILKKQSQRGGLQDQNSSMVDSLHSAANRGEQESGNLLRQMGENTEHAGHKLDECGHESEERH